VEKKTVDHLIVTALTANVVSLIAMVLVKLMKVQNNALIVQVINHF
jgi:hypothetical protein